mgnify:CR=1 FL=1
MMNGRPAKKKALRLSSVTVDRIALALLALEALAFVASLVTSILSTH